MKIPSLTPIIKKPRYSLNMEKMSSSNIDRNLNNNSENHNNLQSHHQATSRILTNNLQNSAREIEQSKLDAKRLLNENNQLLHVPSQLFRQDKNALRSSLNMLNVGGRESELGTSTSAIINLKNNNAEIIKSNNNNKISSAHSFNYDDPLLKYVPKSNKYLKENVTPNTTNMLHDPMASAATLNRSSAIHEQIQRFRDNFNSQQTNMFNVDTKLPPKKMQNFDPNISPTDRIDGQAITEQNLLSSTQQALNLPINKNFINRKPERRNIKSKESDIYNCEVCNITIDASIKIYNWNNTLFLCQSCRKIYYTIWRDILTTNYLELVQCKNNIDAIVEICYKFLTTSSTIKCHKKHVFTDFEHWCEFELKDDVIQRRQEQMIQNEAVTKRKLKYNKTCKICRFKRMIFLLNAIPKLKLKLTPSQISKGKSMNIDVGYIDCEIELNQLYNSNTDFFTSLSKKFGQVLRQPNRHIPKDKRKEIRESGQTGQSSRKSKNSQANPQLQNSNINNLKRNRSTFIQGEEEIKVLEISENEEIEEKTEVTEETERPEDIIADMFRTEFPAVFNDQPPQPASGYPHNPIKNVHFNDNSQAFYNHNNSNNNYKNTESSSSSKSYINSGHYNQTYANVQVSGPVAGGVCTISEPRTQLSTSQTLASGKFTEVTENISTSKMIPFSQYHDSLLNKTRADKLNTAVRTSVTSEGKNRRSSWLDMNLIEPRHTHLTLDERAFAANRLCELRSSYSVDSTIHQLYCVFTFYEKVFQQNDLFVHQHQQNSIPLIPIFKSTSDSFKTTKFGHLQIDWDENHNNKGPLNNDVTDDQPLIESMLTKSTKALELQRKNKARPVDPHSVKDVKDVKLLNQAKTIHDVIKRYLTIIEANSGFNINGTGPSAEQAQSSGMAATTDENAMEVSLNIESPAPEAKLSKSWINIKQKDIKSFSSVLKENVAISAIAHNIFRVMKYNHIRLEIMNNYEPADGKFYLLNKMFCFENDTIKSHLMMNFACEGLAYYKELMKHAEIVSKWPKVVLIIVRFHYIIIVCSRARDKYFLNSDNLNPSVANIFSKNYFLYNTISKISNALPFSSAMIQRLGLYEEVVELYQFLRLADDINLFCLSDTIMDSFVKWDTF